MLGYNITHTLEIKNTSGQYIYDLIFATDNAAGNKIMSDVYNKALTENEKMRLEALQLRRDTKAGQGSFFDADGGTQYTVDHDLRYEHEPPWEPFTGPEKSS